jgi:hypothetical protein
MTTRRWATCSQLATGAAAPPAHVRRGQAPPAALSAPPRAVRAAVGAAVRDEELVGVRLPGRIPGVAQDHTQPEPVTDSTDAMVRDAGRSMLAFRSVQQGNHCVRDDFLYELKAGPAGGTPRF